MDRTLGRSIISEDTGKILQNRLTKVLGWRTLIDMLSDKGGHDTVLDLKRRLFMIHQAFIDLSERFLQELGVNGARVQVGDGFGLA